MKCKWNFRLLLLTQPQCAAGTKIRRLLPVFGCFRALPVSMAHLRLLRAAVTERLAAAAEDILVLVERVMVEREDELIRLYAPTKPATVGGDAHTGPVQRERAYGSVVYFSQ